MCSRVAAPLGFVSSLSLGPGARGLQGLRLGQVWLLNGHGLQRFHFLPFN